MVKNVYEDNPRGKKPKASYASNYAEHHKHLCGRVDYLFTERQPLMTLWQDIAENFYPERADFTVKRSIGDEYASNLTTSVPLLVCRDLGNAISAMLRPPGTTWAHMTTDRPDDQLDNASQTWLQAKTKVMFRAMMDRPAQLTKATKEADFDFAAFGQAVLSAEVNLASNTLLYRNWHLRDVAWQDGPDGAICIVGRKWKPTALDLKIYMGQDKLHANVIRLLEDNGGKNCHTKVEVMHIVVKADQYDGPKQRMPYVSLYIDVTNKHVMEEIGIPTSHYIIPRWQTVSGTQYAHSPATVAALPDARLIQEITYTLLKAGQKAVDPPMIATQEMIKSPIDIQPGGVTWVDGDYDERLGEVLRSMPVDSRGIPVGLNMQDRIQAMLSSSFFLDKLQLPPMQPETTAFEIAQRLQQYVRQALPLFGPIEQEYNAPFCENTFELLMLNGAFGPVEEIPDGLRGSNIRFRFESPLVDANDQQLVQTYTDMINLLNITTPIDPTAIHAIKIPSAFRSTLGGRQVPASWLTSEEEMEAGIAQAKEQQQQMQQAQQLQIGAEAVRTAGEAGQAVNMAQEGA